MILKLLILVCYDNRQREAEIVTAEFKNGNTWPKIPSCNPPHLKWKIKCILPTVQISIEAFCDVFYLGLSLSFWDTTIDLARTRTSRDDLFLDTS